MGLEVEPGDNATGYISNVEGVLNRFSDAIGMIQRGGMRDSDEGLETVKSCQELIDKISKVKAGEESVELLLADPNGHSQILHEKATSTELSEGKSRLLRRPSDAYFQFTNLKNSSYLASGAKIPQDDRPTCLSYLLNLKAIHSPYR